MIYLDHAATTPVKPEVLEAMLPFFSTVFANASGSYTPARESRRAIDQARGEVAEAIGAKRNEIYFTSGGSEADNWALMGTAAAHTERKHVITSKVEHHAVLHACQALEKRGYTVTYLDVDDQGLVLPEAFERAIRPDTLLASVMLANNEIGTIQPVALLSQIAHEHGILMHTDAVQAAGHIPVDMEELGVDMMSLSAHKFGGPKGIGALAVRSGVRIENLIYGGAQERSMRAGTENTPAIVGMGRAIHLATAQMEVSCRCVEAMRSALEQQLFDIPGLHVNGAGAQRLPGIVHVTIDDANAQLLLMQLDMAGICASAGSACTSGAAERSHVIRAMGLAEERQADLRFSIGEGNTMNEMTEAAQTLRRLLKR